MDRNRDAYDKYSEDMRSLSARRAWIEMLDIGAGDSTGGVALRKESVDRNSIYVARLPRAQGRSPQGERG